jgi:hypothetical protein
LLPLILIKEGRMATWKLLVYRVPTEPASGRVSIWRDLKQMGALYLQQCVCIFPARDDLRPRVTRVITKITEQGGEHWLLDVPTMAAADEDRLIANFQSLRNKEYAEIVEECETKFVKEIEFEHFRQNYSFEEAEEISQDLDKIRRWFAKIVDRDWFAADGPDGEDAGIAPAANAAFLVGIAPLAGRRDADPAGDNGIGHKERANNDK